MLRWESERDSNFESSSIIGLCLVPSKYTILLDQATPMFEQSTQNCLDPILCTIHGTQGDLGSINIFMLSVIGSPGIMVTLT